MLTNTASTIHMLTLLTRKALADRKRKMNYHKHSESMEETAKPPTPNSGLTGESPIPKTDIVDI